MMSLKSMALASVAFFGLAACTPKPAESEAAVAPVETSNAVATEIAPTAVDASNTVATNTIGNSVAVPADEPRGNPDRRTSATEASTENSIEAPK